MQGCPGSRWRSRSQAWQPGLFCIGSRRSAASTMAFVTRKLPRNGRPADSAGRLSDYGAPDGPHIGPVTATSLAAHNAG